TPEPANRPGAPPTSGGLAPEGVEAAGVDQLAGQLVADDLLGHAPDLDQPVEIDAGPDAHLLAEQNQLLGADVAGRALLAGERAAAEAADGGVELLDSHAQAGVRVGNPQPARVVQMQRDLFFRPAR